MALELRWEMMGDRGISAIPLEERDFLVLTEKQGKDLGWWVEAQFILLERVCLWPPTGAL